MNNFDEKIYYRLLSWAKQLLKTRKIDNLSEEDLINEAYLILAQTKKDINEIEIKKIAYTIFYKESDIFYSNDRNYLSIGQDNPNYIIKSNIQECYTCKECNNIKPVSEFYLSKKGIGRIVVSPYCKECDKKRSYIYYKKYKCKNIYKTGRVKVYDQYGNVVFIGKNAVEAARKMNISNSAIITILSRGVRCKNIFRYEKNMQKMRNRKG